MLSIAFSFGAERSAFISDSTCPGVGSFAGACMVMFSFLASWAFSVFILECSETIIEANDFTAAFFVFDSTYFDSTISPESAWLSAAMMFASDIFAMLVALGGGGA